MKLIARLFALSLVATGAFASSQIANNGQPSIALKASAWPVPACDPNGTSDCGVCGMPGMSCEVGSN